MRSASSWGFALISVLMFSLLTATALAEPSESDKATARALLDRGDKALSEDNLDEALKAYQGADDIMRVPTTGIELGKLQMKMGKLLEATSTFLRVARYPKASGEPAVFTDSRKEANKFAGEIRGRIPSVVLELKGLKPGVSAEVKIDGSALPPSALTLPRQVNPGEHELVASAKGYKNITTSFKSEEGKTQSLILEFEEGVGAAAPPPPPPPAVPSPQPSGGDDGADDGGGGVGALTIAGFTIGGVGIILGAVMGGLVLSNAATIRDNCATSGAGGPDDETKCSEQEQEDIDNNLVLAHVSTVGFAVGGAGLALGVIGLILDLSGDDGSAGVESESGKTRLRPLIGAGSVGIEGTF
jgi:hypothetical protein